MMSSLSTTAIYFLLLSGIENRALIIRKHDYNQVGTDRLVISSKYFHALLNCNDVLRSMAVRCFAISMPLINYFHSERSIGVDNECGKSDGGVEQCVSPHSLQV
jgi:hypothetical protein